MGFSKELLLVGLVTVLSIKWMWPSDESLSLPRGLVRYQLVQSENGGEQLRAQLPGAVSEQKGLQTPYGTGHQGHQGKGFTV